MIRGEIQVNEYCVGFRFREICSVIVHSGSLDGGYNGGNFQIFNLEIWMR